MKNYLQVNRALAAEKNFRLVNRALAAEKNFRLVNRALAAEKNFRLVNRALAAEKKINFFNNLFSRVKEHSSPTVNRQSTDGQSPERRPVEAGRAASAEKGQPITIRQILRYAAMITLLLTLACGQMWGATTAANGRYIWSNQTVGAAAKFYRLSTGVYQYRIDGSMSQDNDLGLKLINDTTSSGWKWTGCIAFYISSEKQITIYANKKSTKNEVTCQYYVYNITNGSTAFTNFEAGTNNSTTVTVTKGGKVKEVSKVFAALETKKAENDSVDAFTLSAGYYMIMGTESSGYGYLGGIKISAAAGCSTPTSPTGLAAGSLTASGATFTITDGASTNNYEIVCKTTSGSPAADATPTATGTSTSITVNTLSANTTYYAWVRAVCDGSYKSSWVALTSSTFTTLSAPTASFSNSTYAIGGSALDLSSLWSSNSAGSVTYSVEDAAGTGASVSTAAFSATRAGKAKVKAEQAANGSYDAITKYAYITVGSNVEGKHTVTYDLEVNVDKSRIPVTDSVRSTSLYLTTAEGDTLKGTGVTYSGGQKSGLTGRISAPASYDGNKYVYVQFTIADGYTFTPDSAWCVVQPVSNPGTAKLVLSDNNSHTITGGEISCAKGSSVHSYVKNGSSVTLTGTVTLKIYCYGSSTGTYRLGEKINIHGSLAEDASGYTVTYDANGGSGTMTDSNSPYEAGDEVTVLTNTFTKPGYPFTGWSAVDAESNPIDVSSGSFTMPSSNVTITAQWGAALQDKFQDKEHGNGEKTRSGANVTTPTLENTTPVNEYCNDLHYKFIGWVISTSVNDNGTLKNDAVIVPGGQSGWVCTGATYYAVWAAENE